MPQHDQLPIPSAEQQEQASIAEAEILEVMKRLVADGFDWRVVMAATSRALADMVGRIAGPGEVPAHFARMAAITAPLGQKPN